MQHYLCWADFTASIISPVKQVLVTRSELFNWNMCWAKYLFTSKASFGDSFRVGLTEVFAEIWNFLAWYTWYILSNLATENCVLKKKSIRLFILRLLVFFRNSQPQNISFWLCSIWGKRICSIIWCDCFHILLIREWHKALKSLTGNTCGCCIINILNANTNQRLS